ncbi:hypothetical protein G9A89_008936 [Geosiphon pyriformis]|nr:hypothetical protein G9A89_008936 [Geosiphon pyriformis]
MFCLLFSLLPLNGIKALPRPSVGKIITVQEITPKLGKAAEGFCITVIEHGPTEKILDFPDSSTSSMNFGFPHIPEKPFSGPTSFHGYRQCFPSISKPLRRKHRHEPNFLAGYKWLPDRFPDFTQLPSVFSSELSEPESLFSYVKDLTNSLEKVPVADNSEPLKLDDIENESTPERKNISPALDEDFSSDQFHDPEGSQESHDSIKDRAGALNYKPYQGCDIQLFEFQQDSEESEFPNRTKSSLIPTTTELTVWSENINFLITSETAPIAYPDSSFIEEESNCAPHFAWFIPKDTLSCNLKVVFRELFYPAALFACMLILIPTIYRFVQKREDRRISFAPMILCNGEDKRMMQKI